MSVSQLYTYANFEYYRKNGSISILKGGTAIQPFYALSSDIDRLNLAAYLCDVICEVTDEGEEAGDMLRLLLNSLYAVSRDLYPQEIIKGAFEWRVMAMSGYEPDLGGCHRCGNDATEMLYLDVMNGGVLCGDCLHKATSQPRTSGVYDDLREAEILCQMTPAVLAALRYCMDAQPQRLFSFELTDAEDLRLFAHCAETYMLSHIGHGFDTLTFYKSMREPQKGTKV
jgi:DNA repair protein RecO (recombination protein O)